MVKKKAGAGGLHPADCTCGKFGCWSNSEWVKGKVAKAMSEGKPLPSTWPAKYRNLVVQDASGKEVVSAEDGKTPTMSEQVGEILKRKPLPLPSEVQAQRAVITEQVPLNVDIPWPMIAATVNGYLPADAPPSARMDASTEKSAALNESFHKAFPDIMVSPKVGFIIALVFWTLPAWVFWVPRWLKGKLKNFKWPWSKKKPEDDKKDGEPVAEKPEAKP